MRAVRVALGALGANKLRSTLAVLGIVIGVSAVIMMVAMGKGAQLKVEETISKMGVNLVFVWPGAVSKGGSGSRTGSAETLTLEDCEELTKIQHVAGVAPEVRRFHQIKFLNYNENANVTGTTPDIVPIRNFAVERGRFFDAGALAARERVAVLGARIALKLFQEVDPVGRTIQIDRKNFEVIGVLEYKGGDNWARLDDTVYVPVTTALYRLFNRRHLSQITVSIDDRENIDSTVEVVKREMRRLHRIRPHEEDDFQIGNLDEMRKGMDAATGAFTALLGGIALVSLFVGGIGIMNIMLVSVTERTREIGIRKAIGARKADILRQFLIESTTISLLGGGLGIVLGIAGAKLVPKLPLWKAISAGGEWKSVVSPESILVSFGFSCVVGIFFGLYPALKASRLNPVEALRYE